MALTSSVGPCLWAAEWSIVACSGEKVLVTDLSISAVLSVKCLNGILLMIIVVIMVTKVKK